MSQPQRKIKGFKNLEELSEIIASLDNKELKKIIFIISPKTRKSF